jgi:predicted O-methyltransferase YrrM
LLPPPKAMSVFYYFSDFIKRVVTKLERARLSASAPFTASLIREVQRRATDQSVDFIYEKMPKAIFFEDRFKLLRFCLKRIDAGLVAEFGVDAGETINFIARAINGEVHGFDSFHGLPEDWAGHADYSDWFRRRGQPPQVLQNVKLHVGLFSETLPGFLQEHSENFAFIHMDCDLYSSAKTIFQQCSNQIKPGTVIVFDEFFNYPNWQQHEYKAFMEYVQSLSVVFEYLGYSGNQVAVKILSLHGVASSAEDS